LQIKQTQVKYTYPDLLHGSMDYGYHGKQKILRWIKRIYKN